MKRHLEFVIAYLFKFVSFLFMLYLTSLQLNRFISNKDVSTVTIKKFLTSDDKDDYYPTFSICLEENHYGELYNDTYLLEKGITLDGSIKFRDMLKEKEVNETILSLSKSDKVMISLDSQRLSLTHVNKIFSFLFVHLLVCSISSSTFSPNLGQEMKLIIG